MRTLMLMMALGAAGLGCSSSDACDGLGTCLAVTVNAAGGQPINFDQLEVDVTGQVNGKRQVPTTPKPSTLPQTVALEFNPPGGYMGQFGFDVIVTAELHGLPVASGQTHAIMTTGAHSAAMVTIAPGGTTTPGVDMAGATSPSGDMLAHD